MSKCSIIIMGILSFIWAVCFMFQKKYISFILILIYGILVFIDNIIVRNVQESLKEDGEEYLQEDELENIRRYIKISFILGLFRCLIITTVIIIFPLFGIK